MIDESVVQSSHAHCLDSLLSVTVTADLRAALS